MFIQRDSILRQHSLIACQAVKVAAEMDEGNIVVILADGGWKYLSLDFWTKS